jgi:hypothetical protein
MIKRNESEGSSSFPSIKSETSSSFYTGAAQKRAIIETIIQTI